MLPQGFAQVATPTKKPFDHVSPEHAWLCHPLVTGLEPDEWAALIRAFGALHEDQREAALQRRRGCDRKNARAADTGRPPTLTLVDRLLAAFLHDRLGLRQADLAELFGVTRDGIGRRIRQARKLLDLLGRRPQAAHEWPLSLTDLRRLAIDNEMSPNQLIKTAS